MMTMPALFSAALLLLLPATLTEVNKPLPIAVEVKNHLQGAQPLMYSTHVLKGGILLGALKRLMDSDTDFKFTYTEDPNYGVYLESVNGLAGNEKDHTYWELLVKKPNEGIIKPDVGIGCYIPSEYDQIILNFTKW